MPQILVGTSATISQTWEVDGTATNPSPDSTTIGIVRADGTEVVAPGTATVDAGTGVATYALTPTQTAELDILTATWTATFGGQPQSISVDYEIVGGFLFSESQLRAHKVAGGTPFSDATAYPDSKILEVREQVTDDFAERSGWTFTPRFARAELVGTGRRDLLVPDLKVQRVIAASIDGVALSADQLADLRVRSHGVITRKTVGVWTCDADVVISYVHGWERTPGAISNAAILRAAMILLPSPSSTVAMWTSPDGTTYSQDQAGQRLRGTSGVRHYGVPAIDSVLNDPAYHAPRLAVA
jgi:hypothetical protein